MADQNQIEEYLVEKLKKALEELASGEKHLPARLANLYTKFKDLKTSLGGPNQKVLKPREKLYKLDNLLSEWRIHSKKKNHYTLDSLHFVYNYRKELKNIQEELDGTASIGGTRDLPASNGPVTRKEVEDFRWSDRLVDENKVHGIHDKVISLQKFLVSGRENDDRRFSMIGIVGMRGVGKTTLAQVVFNKPEVKKHFLPRIWVCTSKQPEDIRDDFDHRIEIVKRMLMCLGVEEKIIESASQHGLKGLLFALRLQLTGKRYLIVLDDVWCKEEMYERFSTNFCSSLEADENKCSEKLAYGLPKGYGGAVIVTSRIEKLVIKMVGEENLHIVKPLKDPKDCWKIFKDSAGQIDEEVVEDQKAKTVENTASANGYVDQQEEDLNEVKSASANGHVDQQEKDQSEENPAAANGHVDQQVQDQIEKNSASANGQNSNKQEEEEDPIEIEFKELKEKIIEKCAGLPLAARMMGEIARESNRQRRTKVPAEIPQREQQQVAENPGVPESTQSDEQHRQED
ncbi:hypothetical protein RHSIM_Rhsim02G0118600 [Rhododendron simsii]|uniref:NB-ARC domain-containing protein n=1 Tax=Rhododendron simsii TaxID=118357 RepID=A0A834LXZ9_RHOSS|nr:hypothetical protein RHSIM_Rhsim02G0118600 [Rhododendron simsii]